MIITRQLGEFFVFSSINLEMYTILSVYMRSLLYKDIQLGDLSVSSWGLRPHFPWVMSYDIVFFLSRYNHHNIYVLPRVYQFFQLINYPIGACQRMCLYVFTIIFATLHFPFKFNGVGSIFLLFTESFSFGLGNDSWPCLLFS